MSEIISSGDRLSDLPLQEAVKQELDIRLDRVKEAGPEEWATFLSVFKSHFDEISPLVDWSGLRTQGEIQPFPMSFVASSRLAYKAVHGNYEQLSKLEQEGQPISWLKAVKESLEQEEAKKVFAENMWRSPSVSFPQRVVPLQYLLPYFFDNQPISGVDLGAGLHVALPLLNSSTFKEVDFDEKSAISKLADINLQLGLGVDKQERDFDWVMASFPIGRDYNEYRQLIERGYQQAIQHQDQFPFISASLFDQDKYIHVLQMHGKEKFDFAVTSFVRAQLGPENQSVFLSTIGDVVREDGIWIDMGEELLDSEQVRKIREWPVKVYRIQNGRPVLLGTPFFLTADQSRVLRVDPSFFSRQTVDFNPLEKSYEAKINTPDDISQFHAQYTNPLIEEALAKHPEGVKVLMLASGPANGIRYIPDDSRIEVICVDKSEMLLNRAEQTFATRKNVINYIPLDVKNPQDVNKIEVGSCDVATLVNGVIYEPAAMMKALGHALKPGGLAVVNFYLPGSQHMQAFFNKQINERGAKWKDVNLDVGTQNGTRTFNLKGVDFSQVGGFETLGTQVHFQSEKDIQDFIKVMGFEIIGDDKFFFTSPDSPEKPGNETIVMTIRKTLG